VGVGSEIARQFLTQLQKNTPDKRVPSQREVFEKHVRPFLGAKKTAYLWVDTFRFEMGLELARLFREDFEVELQPALATVPTITEIGMAALLPGAHDIAKVLAAGSGKLALEINGAVIKDRKDRVALLKNHADVDGVLDNLRRGVRVLFNMGIEHIDLAANHGHLFADERIVPNTVRSRS
jgi:hypothetical protein